MNTPIDPDWEQRNTDLWTAIDRYEPDEFVRRVDELADELPKDSAIATFERACVRDSTGHSDLAVPLYRAALAKGLSGIRRRRATIQLSSSMRNLGELDEALALLTAEADQPSDELDGAVAAFRSLVLADLGREREGLAVALTALAAYLPRYNASTARHAHALNEPTGPLER